MASTRTGELHSAVDRLTYVRQRLSFSETANRLESIIDKLPALTKRRATRRRSPVTDGEQQSWWGQPPQIAATGFFVHVLYCADPGA